MAKVTSKLQLTLPKRIADQFGIKPGDELEFVPCGDVIHLVPSGRKLAARLSLEERLRLFDLSTARQRQYEEGLPVKERSEARRDWTREDLYDRAKSR